MGLVGNTSKHTDNCSVARLVDRGEVEEDGGSRTQQDSARRMTAEICDLTFELQPSCKSKLSDRNLTLTSSR